MTPDELRTRIDTIEECYEFFLAYAAQGARDDRESPVGGQLRDMLGRMARALNGLGEGVGSLVDAGAFEPEEPARRMAGVLTRDADAARAAVELVAGQESVSSQMVDNLNATIHLRAVLTDLFLMDELGG